MFALLLLACSEVALIPLDEPLEGIVARARIEVEPAWIDFGEVDGGDVEVREVTVRNTGGATLRLEQVLLDSEVDGFALLDDWSGTSLAPGEQLDVAIRWLPLAAHGSAALQIWSDDLDTPAVDVPLSGLSSIAELQLDPALIALGGVDLGCMPQREVVLRNVGRSLLELHAVTIVGDAGFSLLDLDLPPALAPGEETSVWMALEANRVGPRQAALAVSSTEPLGLREAPAEAVVVEGALRRESFTQQDHDARLDLLVAVDSSDSMLDELDELGRTLPWLVASLDEAEVDWQLAVVTSDSGCVTPPMARAGDGFDDQLVARLLGGESGFWSESLLTLASLAVAEGAIGPDDCNAGLLRESTPLWVLAVSDEPDQSYSTYTTYVDRLRDAVDGPVVFSAVAGDVPDGCEEARPGTGYWEASLATGGAFVSICLEDWSNELAALGDQAVQASRFDVISLAETPWVTSIEVAVDGVLADEWGYDAVHNAVVFDVDAVPEPGAFIEVSYLAASDCGD